MKKNGAVRSRSRRPASGRTTRAWRRPSPTSAPSSVTRELSGSIHFGTQTLTRLHRRIPGSCTRTGTTASYGTTALSKRTPGEDQSCVQRPQAALSQLSGPIVTRPAQRHKQRERIHAYLTQVFGHHNAVWDYLQTGAMPPLSSTTTPPSLHERVAEETHARQC